MFKRIISLISMFVLGCTCFLGAMQGQGQGHGQMQGPPPREDRLDDSSTYAKMQLRRAERILSTIVPDPQSYHLILSNIPTLGAEAVAPGVYSKQPTVIVYQGTLSPDRANEEIAFVMAHELGHLNLYHNEEMGKMIDKIFAGPPAGISGLTFVIFYQKFQERQADLFGLKLYKKAGYNLNFFAHTLQQIRYNANIHYGTTNIAHKEPTSLSMKNSHFSMEDRFELLTKLAHANT